MRKFITTSIVICFVALAGCVSGSGDSNDGGQQTDNSGGSTSNSPGSTGGNTGNTGGSSGDTSGGSTGGGSGGGTSSGGSGTGVIYGSFANLYTGSGVGLNILNCSAPSTGNIVFSSAVFRLVNQTENNVDAAITLTPHASFASQFDQTFITINGAFQSDGAFKGNITTVFSLNGNFVAGGQGEIVIIVDEVSSTIDLTFVADTVQQTCNLSGGFFLSETADPGTDGSGGGTGGSNTGGDTGGSSGGGTGGSTGGTGGSSGGGVNTSAPGGTILIDYGQFGTLQMQSSDFPADSGSFEMTTVQYTNSGGFETFSWSNTQDATVNIYPSFFGSNGSTFSNTTFNSTNGRSYSCQCVPTVDLINNEVIFSNLVLNATMTPNATITINGVVSYP